MTDWQVGSARAVALIPGWSGLQRWYLGSAFNNAGLASIVVGIVLIAVVLSANLWTFEVRLWVLTPPLVLGGLLRATYMFLRLGKDRDKQERARGYTTQLTYEIEQDVDMVDWKTGVVLVDAGERSPSRSQVRARVRAARAAGVIPTFLASTLPRRR